MLFAAHYLIVLGVAHVAFGLLRFRRPMCLALREGWFGRLGHSDERKAAFWFISAGPLICLIGGFLRQAALANDRAMSFPSGLVLAILAAAGISAFPKSPLWTLLPPAIMLLML